MVLGMIMMGVTVPAIYGTTEAIRDAQKKQKNRERHQRFQLVAIPNGKVFDEGGGGNEETRRLREAADEIDGKVLVLREGKIYINNHPPSEPPNGHPFDGHFMRYPELDNPDGLVTTFQTNPPVMHWVYVHDQTSELRHGGRPATRGNLVGPMGFTDDGNNVTLLEYEGWCAVEEEPGVWGVYFDREDGVHELPKGKRVVEISLYRYREDDGKGDHASVNAAPSGSKR